LSQEAGWADPNQPVKGDFLYQYLSGELAEGRGFATREQAGHVVVRTLHAT